MEHELELELRAATARAESYRAILDAIPAGVWRYDASGVTTFVNARLAHMLGYEAHQILGRHVCDFLPPAWHEIGLERIRRRARGVSERNDALLRRRDGRTVWVSVDSRPIQNASGEFEGALAILSDASERHGVEEDRGRLAAIVDSSGDAVISTDLEGRITSWNFGAERMFAFGASEILGQPSSRLLPPGRDSDEERLLERTREGESVVHHETVRLRRDGTLLQVSVATAPIRDATGQIVGMSKIVRDLTELRRTEEKLRRTEAQLRQSQKMDAIGRLAGGVAHDFNNMLSVILGYTHMAIEALPADDSARGDLEEVYRAGTKASTLTKQLLAFSRHEPAELQHVDVARVVVDMARMLQRLVGEDVTTHVVTPPRVGPILADRSQIEQVVLNLVVNARDAMPSGGQLTLEVVEVELDAEYATRHAGVVPGMHVMLAVTDTGTGMDDATVAQIFEPFFTTKPPGEGTGLGLATVYGVAKQSRGHVWVYSEPGRGSTFKVYFPRAEDLAQPGLGPKGLPATLQGNETVLVVEDDDQVRNLVCSVLRGRGYEVLDACNGEEAFQQSERHRGRIHLLLTDVVMPRMSGPDLASRLVAARPDLRVLYASGYTANTAVRHGLVEAGAAFLPKPILPDGLLRAVRAALSRAP